MHPRHQAQVIPAYFAARSVLSVCACSVCERTSSTRACGQPDAETVRHASHAVTACFRRAPFRPRVPRASIVRCRGCSGSPASRAAPDRAQVLQDQAPNLDRLSKRRVVAPLVALPIERVGLAVEIVSRLLRMSRRHQRRRLFEILCGISVLQLRMAISPRRASTLAALSE